jgi:hypothetical protein
MPNPSTKEKADASEKMEAAHTRSAETAPKGDKRAAADDTGDVDTKSESPLKKAKIAMPPPVTDNVLNVEKYTLEEGPSESEQSEEDIAKKITSPCLILFGLHPLIREPPLTKMCEDYGRVIHMTVRSAFANRYGHVEFETVDEARKCYKALNGAKLLHKAIMVQPSKAQEKETTKAKETAVSTDQEVEAN